MANVRLLTNMIIEGRFHARGSVLDLSLIPERLRDPDHIERQENREGLVLVLHDLGFPSLPHPGSDGVPTSFPVYVVAGDLLELSRVPPAYRKTLKEGEDYKTDWTFEDQEQLQKAEEAAYLKQFEIRQPEGLQARSR